MRTTFSSDEIAKLKKNPCVFDCTEKSVYYTHEFKKRALVKEDIVEIEKELESLVEKSGYALHTVPGCGVVVAAELIGEIGDIKRFKSPGALAKYAGCAPRECSTGKTKRFRKTRSGNRRLNRAFRRMALSQISRMGNPLGLAYFKRKVSEGKSKQQALVCLRRQMVPIIWMMMKHRREFRYP